MGFASIDPRVALHGTDVRSRPIPCCDHYAGSERFIQKALQLRRESGLRFDITCDAEDGAPVGQERQQIQMILDTLRAEANRGDAVGVRIHPVDSPWWKEELQALVPGLGSQLAYVTVPKVSSLQQLEQVDAALRSLEKQLVPLHILVEQPALFPCLYEVAEHPRVRSLEFGIMDFISASAGVIPASAMESPEQFDHPLIVDAKVQIARSALYFGKVASHNVTIAARDVARTRADAAIARRRFGFVRMWSIHPDQIKAILDGMRPTAGEIELAQRVIHAGADAQWGPVSIDGKLFDRASFRYHWRLLEEAYASKGTLSTATLQRFFPQA